MKKNEIKKELTVEQKITRRNFISFATFIGLGGAAFGGWKWLYNSHAETAGITAGTRLPLRRATQSVDASKEL